MKAIKNILGTVVALATFAGYATILATIVVIVKIALNAY